MLIRDLPTGATFRRGLHTYRIIGETYDRPQDSDVHGVGSSDARRDVVRTDGRGGVLHVPVLWTAHRDPGRHADPNRPIDDMRHKLSTFDPARVPVGGTVRVDLGTGGTWRPTMTVRKFPTPIGSIRVTSKNGSRLIFKRRAVSRDPGRHRGGDDVEAEMIAAHPLPAPELPYAGPWSLDGHGNVRVPVTLVRNLLSDLRSIQSVIYENSDPLTLDDWPAAREFILGAREV